MIRMTAAPPTIAPGEARYFQLMAIGSLDEEPEPLSTVRRAWAPPFAPLIGARRFQLMAIGTLDDEPEPALIDLVA